MSGKHITVAVVFAAIAYVIGMIIGVGIARNKDAEAEIKRLKAALNESRAQAAAQAREFQNQLDAERAKYKSAAASPPKQQKPREVRRAVPNVPPRRESQPIETRQQFFGVRLGQTLSSLKTRFHVAPLAYGPKDPDYRNLLTLWLLTPTSPDVALLGVSIFQNRVCSINVHFSDTSEANYRALTQAFKAKYKVEKSEGFADELFGELNFTTVVDGVPVSISLNRDDNFGLEADTLTVTYSHIPLIAELDAQSQARKAARVRDNL